MCNIYNLTHRFNFLTHVVVLIVDLNGNALLAIFGFEFIRYIQKVGFTFLELLAIKVTNNIAHFGQFNVALDG
ncbi:hypothetical protein D3C73_1295790 [compost metagenome]